MEKKENMRLTLIIEEQKDLIKDLETRIANLTVEVGKKSQKVTQVYSTIHILQTQLERLRLEMDEEKLASEKEISNLQSSITEKEILLERYKSQLGMEKDMKGESGIGFETTGNFDSIFESDFENFLDSNANDLNQFPSNPAASNNVIPTLSPRSQMIDSQKLSVDEITNQMAFFLKKKSFTIPEEESRKEMMLDKGCQTKENPIVELKPAEDPNSSLVADLKEHISKLDSEIATLNRDLVDANKRIDLYKVHLKEKDTQIDDLSQKIVWCSEEHSKTINDINEEYTKLVEKYMGLRKS